jgi:hypothetical protein
MREFLINTVGTLLVFTGIFDASKYFFQGYKIQKAQSAKNFSRQFMNIAIGNDIIRILYGVLILDVYIILTSVLAFITMVYMWYQIYWWYPYRKRGLHNFKRPNIFVYFINSLLPNRIRKRL